MSRRIVGPFNRVEGDLEVQLELADGKVREAWVTSPMYRGFEQMLVGRHPLDALVYTPRICGICSVAQSAASALALADAQQLAMPRNGELALNLILATENVADHLTHFYLFFMPDFARGVYGTEPWHAAVAQRFAAVHGSAAGDVLPARAQFLHLMGLLAGKWPHSLSIQPGGITRAIEPHEQARILNVLAGLRRFLETHLFGDTLEHIIALQSAAELEQWGTADDPARSDLRMFLHIAQQLQLEKLGRASDTFMSYGAYRIEGAPWLPRGVWQGGGTQPLDLDAISEDLSHSWLAHRSTARHPLDGVTQPDADAENGYTWCKAPRLAGQVVEVGALARQLLDGHPLMVDLVTHSGGNVRNRVIGRLLEMARVVVAMEQWCRDIQPRQPFYVDAPLPDEAQGVGLIEAARGGLGHWLRIKKGRLLNYQIIAPTTWNFSPRDASGTPGALEQALVGAPLRDGETEPVAVQHIVRSFDPCMVCTVH